MSALRDHIARWSKGRDDDMKEMGRTLAGRWDLMSARLEGLAANDPEGKETICAASELLQLLTTTFGPISGWTLAQHWALHRHACRIWGSEQRIVSKPAWTER